MAKPPTCTPTETDGMDRFPIVRQIVCTGVILRTVRITRILYTAMVN